MLEIAHSSNLKGTPAEPETWALAWTQTWAVKAIFQQSRRMKFDVTWTATGHRLGCVGGCMRWWDGAEKKPLQARYFTSTDTPHHCYALLLHIYVAAPSPQITKPLPTPARLSPGAPSPALTLNLP